MPEFLPPGAKETELIGNWRIIDGKVVSDDVVHRVTQLTENYLEYLEKDWSGWDTLYRDPADGRFWERIYLQSYMHGGGPASLRMILPEDAGKKYPHLFDT